MNSASVASGKVDVFTVIKAVLSLLKIKNITYINLSKCGILIDVKYWILGTFQH